MGVIDNPQPMYHRPANDPRNLTKETKMSDVCEFGANGKVVIACPRYKQLEEENERLRKVAEKIVEIKQWCKDNRVTYDRYKTALDERIEAIEQVLKGE